jgi:hypothetical protein
MNPLARYLIDHHAVTEARARGWEQLENLELLTVAEAAGFEVLVTTDKNLSYQQNLAGRKIAIVVLGKGGWSLINPHYKQGRAALFRPNDPDNADKPAPPEDAERKLFRGG